MQLFIDLEAHPDLSTGAMQRYIDAVEAPGQYKKPESIAEWKAQNADSIGREQWARSALDPMAGGIYVIGYNIDGGQGGAFTRNPHEPEGPFLQAALSALATMISKEGQPRSPRWVGFNHINFDLPYLAKRCAILGVNPALKIPTGSRYNNERVLDIMQAWCGYKEYISQKALAKAMGLPQDPSDIDGKDLWSAVEKGGVKVAEEKCRKDIETLMNIYSRMAPVFGF